MDQLYADLAGVGAERRIEALAKAARLLVRPPQLPASWSEARERIVPALKPRIAVTLEEIRREATGRMLPTVRSEVTPHALLELVVPTEIGSLTVHAEALSGWGGSPQDAFDTCGV